MKQTHWLPIALIILLLGCTPTDYEEPTATNEPEAVARRVTSTPIPPTSTATWEPTQDATQIRRPTRTPQPLTVAPIAMPTLTRPEIAGTVVAIQPPREHDSYLSPDGRKRADVIIHDCVDIRLEAPISEHFVLTYEVETLNVVDLDDDSKSVIDDQVGDCIRYGTFGFEGLFWSENSRFFYYTQSREGAHHGCGRSWFPTIYRYDSEEKTSVEMGMAERSPDGTKLAVRKQLWEQSEVVVWDVNSGEKIHSLPELDMDGNVRGALAWSPDGESFVYGLAEPCGTGEPPSGSAYLIKADLSDLTQTILFDVDMQEFPYAFSEIVWNDPAKLIFDGSWTYDLEMGTLTQISGE